MRLPDRFDQQTRTTLASVEQTERQAQYNLIDAISVHLVIPDGRVHFGQIRTRRRISMSGRDRPKTAVLWVQLRRQRSAMKSATLTRLVDPGSKIALLIGDSYTPYSELSFSSIRLAGRTAAHSIALSLPTSVRR